jgi:hypothetical protein
MTLGQGSAVTFLKPFLVELGAGSVLELAPAGWRLTLPSGTTSTIASSPSVPVVCTIPGVGSSLRGLSPAAAAGLGQPGSTLRVADWNRYALWIGPGGGLAFDARSGAVVALDFGFNADLSGGSTILRVDAVNATLATAVSLTANGSALVPDAASQARQLLAAAGAAHGSDVCAGPGSRARSLLGPLGRTGLIA